MSSSTLFWILGYRLSVAVTSFCEIQQSATVADALDSQQRLFLSALRESLAHVRIRWIGSTPRDETLRDVLELKSEEVAQLRAANVVA